MKIKMTNGYSVAELYRETYSKNKRMEAMGLRVYNTRTGLMEHFIGTVMPKNDEEGCDFEFERILDKCFKAGFHFGIS